MVQAGTQGQLLAQHKEASALEITLRVGETYTLPLQGRGSAGYSWNYTISGDRNAVEVLVEGASAPPQPGGKPPPTGSAQERLVLKAKEPGKATVELALRRSWEKNRSPLSELRILVTVVSFDPLQLPAD